MVVVYQIDDYVFGEFLVEFEGELGCEYYCFGIVVVYVQYWGGDYFGYVGGIVCGLCIQWVGGGEIDLVVDYDVYCVIDGEVVGLGYLEQFYDYVLVGEGCVVVDQDWYDLFVGSVVVMFLV